MAFKINHEESNAGEKKESKGFSVLPEGTEVEVYPIDFEVTESAAGNQMAVFSYKIRDDVEQPGQGREIRFDRFVETEKAMWRIQAASKAALLEDGKDYESIEEWAKDFKGQAVRLVLGVREYNGKEYNEVKFFNESKVGGVYEPSEELTGTIVDNDDLPF